MAAARAVLNGPARSAGPELEASALAFGLALPDLDGNEPAPLDVWAENWPAVRLFMSLQTQLIVGFGGVEGINYAVLPLVERRLRLSPRQARDAFWGLQVMERALIAHCHKGAA